MAPASESVMTRTPAIQAALLGAQKHLASVVKDARNRHHGYSYTSAEAIIGAAREALHAHGLVVRRGSWSIVADVDPKIARQSFHIDHPDSGETREDQCDFFIVPHDGMPYDKAHAAALTSCLNYYLRDVLLLPRVDDSMDTRDDRGWKPEPQARRGNGAPPPPAQHPEPAQPETPKAAPVSGAVYTVVEVKTLKTGEGKKGPWTLSAITTADGHEFRTFSDSIVTTAQAAQKAGTPVTIRFTTDPKYGSHTIDQEGLAHAAPAGQETNYESAVNGVSVVTRQTDNGPTEVYTIHTVGGDYVTCDSRLAEQFRAHVGSDRRPVFATRPIAGDRHEVLRIEESPN